MSVKVKAASEEAWEDMKVGTEQAWDNVKSGVEGGWSSLKRAMDKAHQIKIKPKTVRSGVGQSFYRQEFLNVPIAFYFL
ncbi:MAG: hypothetical protein R3B95_14220 [Nitrospirales bacterium]|nr:hypothetical protein [Nitrospirales bacterium]